MPRRLTINAQLYSLGDTWRNSILRKKKAFENNWLQSLNRNLKFTEAMQRNAAMSIRDTLVISRVSFSHSETARDLLMFIFMLSSRFLDFVGEKMCLMSLKLQLIWWNKSRCWVVRFLIKLKTLKKIFWIFFWYFIINLSLFIDVYAFINQISISIKSHKLQVD
jgi:hypothetical protein